MPSTQCDMPIMVDKGTQCALLTTPKKSFQSSVTRDAISPDSNEGQHPRNSDRYNSNVSGDVYHMSIGPTVVYKLDPDATREILLSNPDFSHQYDDVCSLSSPSGWLSRRHKKLSLNDQNTECQVDAHLPNSKPEIDLVVGGAGWDRGCCSCCRLKTGHSLSLSPQNCQKIKKLKPNGNFQALFTYGIGGFLFNYLRFRKDLDLLVAMGFDANDCTQALKYEKDVHKVAESLLQINDKTRNSEPCNVTKWAKSSCSDKRLSYLSDANVD